MGQAKRRRENAAPVVYHHTSTLRSNLIWMSGVIGLEGASPRVWHPKLGEIHTDVFQRRAMEDFPAVAWFTSQIEVPRCLIQASVYGVDKVTGNRIEFDLGADGANVLALNRLALGFPVATPGLIHWPSYRGYSTAEGQELNETAIEAGDNPDHWYVSESPVDVMLATEVWSSGSIMKPRLRRFDNYLKDVHAMVRSCREGKISYIPPAWLTPEEARMLASHLGVPMRSADELR